MPQSSPRATSPNNGATGSTTARQTSPKPPGGPATVMRRKAAADRAEKSANQRPSSTRAAGAGGSSSTMLSESPPSPVDPIEPKGEALWLNTDIGESILDTEDTNEDESGLYTDESPGLKVDPVVVMTLSVVFIFSVVALHGTFTLLSSSTTTANNRRSHRQDHAQVLRINTPPPTDPHTIMFTSFSNRLALCCSDTNLFSPDLTTAVFSSFLWRLTGEINKMLGCLFWSANTMVYISATRRGCGITGVGVGSRVSGSTLEWLVYD